MIRSLTLAALALVGLFASGCYVRARPARTVTYSGTVSATAGAPAAQGVVVYQAPPPAQATIAVNARPPAPYPNSVWVDGHWEWNGNQYVWMNGYWVQGRVNHVYIQPRWERRGNGYVYVTGSWRPASGRSRVVVQRPRTNVVVQPAAPRATIRVGGRPRGRTTTTVVQQPRGQTTVRTVGPPRGPTTTVRQQNRRRNNRPRGTVRVQGSGTVRTQGASGSGRATVRVR